MFRNVLNLIDSSGESRDPSRGGISIKRSLGDCLMQVRGGLTKGGTGDFGVLVLQGGFHFLHYCFDAAHNRSIALMSFYRLASPFNC